jgi:hypothetical protein
MSPLTAPQVENISRPFITDEEYDGGDRSPVAQKN